MRADDFCLLAAELANEHGALALQFARRASSEYESEGVHDRARFWHALALFLDDIMNFRLDPDRPIVLH
jgi:hypothetical protein